METNHTKITGVANCPTLSEQPVTTKRNNFLGYIGADLTSPLPPFFSANLPRINEPVNINPMYNSPYNPIGDISNQVKKSVHEIAIDHDSNNHQNQIQGDQPQPSGYEVNIAPEENQQPIPYRHQIYLESAQNDELNENFSTKWSQQEPTASYYDQTVQERQISKLTSEIEELRAKLQELESENERLTQDLNQHNTVQIVDRIFGSSRPIIPLEQIPSLSTIKPPNEDFERMP